MPVDSAALVIWFASELWPRAGVIFIDQSVIFIDQNGNGPGVRLRYRDEGRDGRLL